MQYLPTNPQQLKKISGRDIKVITYPEIESYSTIGDVLRPYGSTIILYMTGEGYGHWVALFKTDNGPIEFFDSYGYFPDSELKFTNPEYNSHMIIEYPFILKLLYDTEYPIEYNEHKYQSKKDGISTCGRWCAFRIRYKWMSNDEFFNFIKRLSKYFNIKDKDELIAEITSLYE